MSDVATLTRAERTDLLKVARMNARVAKSGIAAREAELMAEFESQLAAQYPANDPRWSAIVSEAERAVATADAAVREACRKAGIREEFRPRLDIHWYSRGENGVASRRNELRKVAQAAISAAGKAAKLQIERTEADVCTSILSDGLRSEAAAAALSSIPTPEQLMPTLRLAEVEQLSGAASRTRDRASLGVVR